MTTTAVFDIAVSNPAPIPGCPTCDGSGWDAAFGNACDCPRFVKGNLNHRLAAGHDSDGLVSGHPRGDSQHRPQGPPQRVTYAATDKQLAFLRILVAERDASNPAVQAVVILLDRPLSKRDASTAIDAMLAIRPTARPAAQEPPAAPAPQAVVGLDLTVLPSGRYAVPGGDTRLKVQVDVVTSGKWAGWVFVKDAAEYGHGQRYGSQRPGQAYRGDIEDALCAILADPQSASAAYGRLVGRCGICNRTLEDEQSVARGIGPVCAGKVGW